MFSDVLICFFANKMRRKRWPAKTNLGEPKRASWFTLLTRQWLRSLAAFNGLLSSLCALFSPAMANPQTIEMFYWNAENGDQKVPVRQS